MNKRLNYRSWLFAAVALWFSVSNAANEDAVSIITPGIVFEALALNRDLPTPARPKYRSPTELVPSPDGGRIYICEQTAKRITVFDVKTGAVLPDRILLPNEVTGCAVSPDGSTLYATCGSEYWPNGFVFMISTATGKVLKRVAVGHFPRSPVIDPAGTTLYVCNLFSNNISVIDVVTGQEKERIPVVREPYCADLTPDGRTLVVGNSLPDDRSTDSEFVSCKISIIDLATHKTDNIRLTRGSHSVFGLTVSPDGKYAFATHLIGKFNLVGTTVEKGWLHTNNIAVIDLTAKKFVNDACLDLALMGMGNPWSIKCTNDGAFMVVAHAGSNELSIIDLPRLIDTAVNYSDPDVAMHNNFTSIIDIRRRVMVRTKGPRALAIIGKSVFTAGYFDDETATMEEYEIGLATSRPLSIHTIGNPQPWNGERRGENNFYDATLCRQSWQSCHSCHPHTRPDALNWILGGGTIQTPKNAKSMLYSWWTPPTKWDGLRAHAQNSIIAGVETELVRTPTRDVCAPLDTFLMGLKPVTSPYLVRGRLSEAAKRGKKIFYDQNKVDCSKCHPAPLFTNLKAANAGVPDQWDGNTSWDTPSLTECWRTGPYGHLGNQWGMHEILELPGHSNAAGILSSEEMDDLVEYVLSL